MQSRTFSIAVHYSYGTENSLKDSGKLLGEAKYRPCQKHADCCFCDDEAGFFSPASSSPLFSASVQGSSQPLPRLEKRGNY